VDLQRESENKANNVKESKAKSNKESNVNGAISLDYGWLNGS
jgi:hypothetical protein